MQARAAIADEANGIYVSAASAWEVATEARLGKLPGAELIAQEFGEHLTRQGFIGLDITIAHGQRGESLPGPHRDPLDRMLIAQAQAEQLTVVSNDTVFDQYRVVRLW